MGFQEKAEEARTGAFDMSQLSGLVPAAWVFVRLVLGWEWARAGWEKIGDAAWTSEPAGRAVTGFLGGAVELAGEETAHPEVQGWFATLSEDFLIPNAELFAYVVAWGELLVGIALIVGLFTRLTAMFGVTMNLAFLWAGTTSTNPPLLLLGLAILVMGTRSGVYGIDGWLMPRLLEAAGERTVFAGRVVTGAAAIVFAAWLAFIASDGATWLIAATIAVAVAALAWLAPPELRPAPRHIPAHR